MKLSEWQLRLNALDTEVKKAAMALVDAEEQRSEFLRETIGIEVGDSITLPGIVAMVHRRVVEMTREERNG